MPKNDPAGYLPAVKKARKGKTGKAPAKGKRTAPAVPPAGFQAAAGMAMRPKKR